MDIGAGNQQSLRRRLGKSAQHCWTIALIPFQLGKIWAETEGTLQLCTFHYILIILICLLKLASIAFSWLKTHSSFYNCESMNLSINLISFKWSRISMRSGKSPINQSTKINLSCKEWPSDQFRL